MLHQKTECSKCFICFYFGAVDKLFEARNCCALAGAKNEMIRRSETRNWLREPLMYRASTTDGFHWKSPSSIFFIRFPLALLLPQVSWRCSCRLEIVNISYRMAYFSAPADWLSFANVACHFCAPPETGDHVTIPIWTELLRFWN